MLRLAITSLTLGLFSFMTPDAGSAVAVEKIVPASASVSSLSFAQKQLAFDAHVADLYKQAGLEKAGLAFDVFNKAYVGHRNFKQQGKLNKKKELLTVIDFTKTSNHKRLWIVDLNAGKLVYHSLVAHGKNTGEVKAVNFSNELNSNMSSMGFYITDETYFGKHGLSLRLNGMDGKFNSNARSRAIVMHGADYVSDDFLKQYGRLGRSLGCPAIPREISKEVVELIKDNTTMYIHSADKTYASDHLNSVKAVEAFAMEASLFSDNA
jgi:hypothetical protein